ncbi:LppP/LprE family lipoprotein [Nocardia sp. NPDC058058]|uniref:LppP/LprE family lipoprotein n=1 Tax=Nocardia sp. NPDC058058 TaxID=3346317 RepID=UPI0036D8B5E6
MKRVIGILVAVTAVALSAACQDDGTTPAGGSPTASTVTTDSGTTAPQVTQPTVAESTPNPQQPTGTTKPGGTAPATAGNGKCVDLNSPVVTAALGTLGPNVGGDGFYADSGTPAVLGSCPALLWVLAGTPRGTASSPWHVLFFNHSRYLGTATKHWTAYTTVVGSSDRSVQVQYRWLSDTDPSCCPSGGPVTVTLTLGADDHTVTPDRDFPTQATNPH